MVAIEQGSANPGHATGAGGIRSLTARVEERIRALSIRWRIAAIAGLNGALVLLLATLIYDGARDLEAAWAEHSEARRSERLLAGVENEAGRLQGLIHRYFNEPRQDLLAEIENRRDALLSIQMTRAASDPALTASMESLATATQGFLAGFDALRRLRQRIAAIYDREIVPAANEIATLYGTIEIAARERHSPLLPMLSDSREMFASALVAANGYYASRALASKEQAVGNFAAIEKGLNEAANVAQTDSERSALTLLRDRTSNLRQSIERLSDAFGGQTALLRDAIDGNQVSMAQATERLAEGLRARETQTQMRFDATLRGVYVKIAGVGLIFLVLIITVGIAISRSISTPLRDLMRAMHGIVSGDYDKRVSGVDARDEVGEMARAVEVFRGNAIARRRAERELRASKERSEDALSELRDTQKSLIEAEKLAALGGLVAGVAHEVNNPIGISLTVASSLSQRCNAFGDEIAHGQLRRSRLLEFVDGSRDAAAQLVANLQRAAELVQSFKQVAVDRSHEERRRFDLRELTQQIIASLRPGLKKADLSLESTIEPGILLDSYAGAYGQVLTNLVLNAANHAFPSGRPGTVRIQAVRPGPQHVEISFSDDGAGMPEDVRARAFEPFFTTRRDQGGTGLGLHIVYNLVTRRLGGRIALTSAGGRGTTFRITIPLEAPRAAAAAVAGAQAQSDR